MRSPKRHPLSRITANILEEEILKGTWEKRLPGTRTLIAELSVSQKTLIAALTILTRRGLLLPSEQGKPRYIAQKARQITREQAIKERRTLIIASAESNHTMNPVTQNVCNQIRHGFEEKNWRFQYVHTPEVTSTPGPNLQAIQLKYPHARWLLVMASNATIKWAENQNIRAVCLGGDFTGVRIPSVAVSLYDIIDKAIQALVKRNHSRIIVTLGKLPSFLAAALEPAFRRHGIQFHQPYHLPEIPEDSANAFRSCLIKLFDRTPPTALIITTEAQLIAVFSFCSERNLSIPKDLAVIAIDKFENIDWFTPSITHFSLPVPKLVSSLTNYIEQYPKDKPEALIVKPILEPNASI